MGLTLKITRDNDELQRLLKAERNKALQEAIDVCEMWKKDCEKEKELHAYGKVNILGLCIQRIEEKITGVRRWD